MNHQLIFVNQEYTGLQEYLQQSDCHRILLVHGHSLRNLAIGKFFMAVVPRMGIEIVEYTDFHSNPCIESAVRGAKLCRDKNCDMIVGCGGGSALDVAKCIRLFCEADMDRPEFWKNLPTGKLPLLAIPTTAGTGSEATHFAVVYYKGDKLSIGEMNNIPSVTIIDPDVLCSLPLYQKRSTMLDALCHAIESYWSIHATLESQFYAREALRIINNNYQEYLREQSSLQCRLDMMMAAHLAGKAINISKTTAGHAMCYKLTSLYGVPHGEAAMLCLTRLWSLMLRMPTGETLQQAFQEISHAMGCVSANEVVKRLVKLLHAWGMDVPLEKSVGKVSLQAQMLATSVNSERLQNHPVPLDEDDFYYVYQQILTGKFLGVEGE